MVNSVENKMYEEWLMSLRFFSPENSGFGRLHNGLQLPSEGQVMISTLW